jgi:hypothetical protein
MTTSELTGDDLEELSTLSASGRQLALAVVLTIVVGVVMGIGLVALDITSKKAAYLILAGIVAAASLATRLRTPSHRFPSIQVLRFHPSDVRWVVTIVRGGTKRILALVDAEHRLLARPHVLKGTFVPGRGGVDRAVAADKQNLARALTIVQARCPAARTAEITVSIGISSLASLARKAVERASQ